MRLSNALYGANDVARRTGAAPSAGRRGIHGPTTRGSLGGARHRDRVARRHSSRRHQPPGSSGMGGRTECRFLTLEQLHRLANAAGANRGWCTCWGPAGCGSVRPLSSGGATSTSTPCACGSRARSRSSTGCSRSARPRTGRPPHPRAVGEQTVYNFTLHELRHTAASLAIQAGASIKAL
jgi:hypothetical protein